MARDIPRFGGWSALFIATVLILCTLPAAQQRETVSFAAPDVARTIEHDGRTRGYRLYLPSSLD